MAQLSLGALLQNFEANTTTHSILEYLWKPLLQSLRDIVVIIDAAHCIVETNQPDPASHLGKSVYEMLPPNQHLIFRQALEQAQTTGKVTHYEVISFQQRWYRGAIHPLPDNERCLGFITISRDVTEQRQTQYELAIERSRAAQYLDLANVIFVALDPQGKITLINQKCCDLLGYTKEELMGVDWFETCVPMSIRTIARRNFEIRLSGKMGEKTSYENLVITRTGEIRVIVWHNTLIYGNDGTVTETLGAGEDITDFKEAEKQKFYQGKFQQLLITLATQFINIPSMQIDQALTSALEEVGTFFGAMRTGINIFTPDKKSVICTHEWCDDPAYALLPENAASPIAIFTTVYPRLARGETCFLKLEDIPNSEIQERYLEFGVGSAVMVPLQYHGDVMGVLVIWNPPEMEIPTELEAALRVLSEICVNAITRSSIEAQSEKHRLELESLLDIGLMTDSTLPLSEILHTALLQLVRLIPCTSASIMLFGEDEKLHFSNTWGMPEYVDLTVIETMLNQDDHWRKFYVGNLPVIIADVHQSPLWVNIPAQEHLRSWMGIQMTHRGKLIGVLNFDHRLPNVYHTPHADLAMSVASQLATTIANSQMVVQLEARVEERTRLLQMEILIRQESEMREYKQREFAEALLDITTALTSSLELEKVVEQILVNIERVLQHNATRIFLIEDEDAVLIGYHGVSDGGIDPRVQRIHIPSTDYMPTVIATRQPYVMNDTYNNPRFIPTLSNADWRSSISMPLLWEDTVIGFLNLGSHQLDFFQAQQIEHLRYFAMQAALAIQNAKLYEQAQEVAVYAERQRLARELHDSVTQTLFSAHSIAQALQHIYTKKPEKAADYMRELTELTRSAMAEMRSLLIELRPESIVKTEISVLIQQLVESFTGATGIPVSVHINDRFFLPEKMQIAFYRITQESFNNIAKHANATQVMLRLNKLDTLIRLEVQDNGRGFNQAHIPPNHFGLKIMQERASSIGAELAIVSAPDQGTLVILMGYLL